MKDDALQKIAKILGVIVEGIMHFTEDSVFNNINNFPDNSIRSLKTNGSGNWRVVFSIFSELKNIEVFPNKSTNTRIENCI
ncbi:hypothetical protein [Mucilaginibacter aquaedulcis]|uniref:hypothetical protein n=1 Tax=Mucilaginibacter aquaedulcis TaxID=1187081 RepID=UPI0025B5A933|nr:hypothetical protein [Mucilaginibacter aquaedulcis]MDN3548906.1 hypothetical protein [Mucilaginibacter aquaedulcis]